MKQFYKHDPNDCVVFIQNKFKDVKKVFIQFVETVKSWCHSTELWKDMVKRNLQRVLWSCSFKDKSRDGRTRKFTQEHIYQVHVFINDNKYLSVRNISNITNISKTSVNNILKNDLFLTVYHQINVYIIALLFFLSTTNWLKSYLLHLNFV